MEGRRRMKEEKQEEGRRKDEEGEGSRRKRMEEEGGNEERKGSKRERRRKKSRERKTNDGTGAPPGGLWEPPRSPLGGVGRRAEGGFGAFLDLFKLILLEKTKQPQTRGKTPNPPWGPQNSPGTSQNLWEGSLYTFLQPTPNPKISEYF